MTDEAEVKRWMLLIVPGVGEIVCWMNPELLATGAVIEVENPTRILINPRTGEAGLQKMADGPIPINCAALPTWRQAPEGLVPEVSKLWDRLIVPEPKKLRLAHD